MKETIMRRFEGRVAIVSGAAQGIGRAIAERLGQEGATVAVADLNEKGAESTAKAIGGKAFAVTCDIGDPESVTRLHKTVIDKAGKLDVLVNAAAIVPFVPWDTL
ncbi:MAG: SDR family NAD(P)-dependent oxidoreductase, partial [Dongiaceae bacterium]